MIAPPVHKFPVKFNDNERTSASKGSTSTQWPTDDEANTSSHNGVGGGEEWVIKSDQENYIKSLGRRNSRLSVVVVSHIDD
jgi:hypothetical protein